MISALLFLATCQFSAGRQLSRKVMASLQTDAHHEASVGQFSSQMLHDVVRHKGRDLLPPKPGLPLARTSFVEAGSAGSSGEAASLRQIFIIYALVLVPILVVWKSASTMSGYSKYRAATLLPMTLCGMIIGQDFVNQSLSLWMQSPMAISAFQAITMTLVTTIWVCFLNKQNPIFSKATARGLTTWLPAGIAFSLFQLINHQVSYACSLSERVVFMNLCPAILMILESVVMPIELRQKVSNTSKLALIAMVLGAVVFAIQYQDFTFQGVLSASVLISVVIPYRLMQRWFLHSCKDLPVPLLCAVDGVLLFAPSTAIMEINLHTFWSQWKSWMEVSYVAVALVISVICFTGNHATSLYLLRESSATSYQVFYNMANFILVLLGVVMFHDRVLQAPLVVAGICVSLGGGIVYGVNSANASSVEAEISCSKSGSLKAAPGTCDDNESNAWS